MKAPGKIVPVSDTKMHVYCETLDNPENYAPIVFLAGSGTGCPMYDFKPLWQMLKDRFQIVIVNQMR